MKKNFLAAFVIFAVIVFAGACNAALVYGSVYDANLEVLDKAVVSINSTPEQVAVAANGSYEFQVEPGSYLLKAEYREENQSSPHTASEEIVVEEAGGEYEIDLIILSYAAPATEKNKELEGLAASFPQEGEAVEPTLQQQAPATEGVAFLVLAAAVLVIALAALAFLFLGGKRGRDKTVGAGKAVAKMIRAREKKAGAGARVVLTGEQRELLKKIVESGGRTTQRELRKLVAYSEAKVSLDLDVLEAQGLVKRFRKGRGNIIVLQEREKEKEK